PASQACQEVNIARRCSGRGQSSPAEALPDPPPRSDLELHEHLAEVPLDGADTDEQLRSDFCVRTALSGKMSDLELLGGKGGGCTGGSLACGLPRRGQLAGCALCERLHTEDGEALVRAT